MRCVIIAALAAMPLLALPLIAGPAFAGNEQPYEGPALPVSGCTPYRVGLVPSLTDDTTNCPTTALVDQFFLTERDPVSPPGNECRVGRDHDQFTHERSWSFARRSTHGLRRARASATPRESAAALAVIAYTCRPPPPEGGVRLHLTLPPGYVAALTTLNWLRAADTIDAAAVLAAFGELRRTQRPSGRGFLRAAARQVARGEGAARVSSRGRGDAASSRRAAS